MVNWCSSLIRFCISWMSVDSVSPGDGNVVVHIVSVITRWFKYDRD